MTRERTKELLDAGVLQAWAEGKPLQFSPWQSSVWLDSTDTSKFFHDLKVKWRVKPEPRRWWVNVYKGGCMGSWHPTKEAALDARGGHDVVETIQIQEVL